MLTAILTASLATIDYSCRAQRMELVVPELERVTSLDLAVSQELRDEVVVIDVRNVETDTLLEKIAFVLRADWHERNGVRTLERDGTRRAKNEQEDEQALRARLTMEFDGAFSDARKPITQTSLQQLTADLANFSSLSEERRDEAQMEWYAIDPMIRAVPHLLESVDWSVVRRSWGASAVFASHPQVFESALEPAGSKRALDGIVRDFAAIKAACDRRGIRIDSHWSTMQWEQAANFAASSDARIYLRTGLPYSSVAVVVTNAAGQKWANQGTGSRSTTELPTPEEIGFDQATIKDGPFYSDESKALSMFVRDFTKQPSEGLTAALTDPMKRDPLSFFETDFLLALNKQLESNLVAAPSELDAITDFTRGTPGGSMRESLTAFLRQHETKFGDGWVVARPRLLAGQEYVQLDRRALARMAKQLQSDGSLQLTDVALAFSPSPSFVYRLLWAYILASSPKFPVNDDFDGAPLEFGTLYRAMTESERRNAETTGLRVKSLSAKATDAFRFHIWPTVEAQVTHDPDNPRPYHGWTHPLTLPPDDLTVTLKTQVITETRALRDGNWVRVPERSDFDSFFGKEMTKEMGDSLYSLALKDLNGLPIKETSIERRYFEFTSRIWTRKGEVGFSFPTGLGRSVRSDRSDRSGFPAKEVNSRSADGSSVLLR